VSQELGGQRFWTTQALAEKAGVYPSRIRQLCISGRFPGATKVGKKSWLIPDDDAQRWLTSDRDRRYKQAEDSEQ